MSEVSSEELERWRNIVKAAYHAVAVWAGPYNEAVSHEDFECAELDDAMMAIVNALTKGTVVAPQPAQVEASKP